MVQKHNGREPGFSEVAIVAGLGNPGEDYEYTYHNAGFIAVDLLSGRGAFRIAKTGTFAECETNGVHFVKPLTFMNDSGRGVADALHYFRKKPETLAVIHDDADIPLGEYKIQFGRGAAGHHGVESIIGVLKTNAFWRVRIGIGKETGEGKKIPASRTVLTRLSKSDLSLLETIADELRPWLLPSATSPRTGM